MSRQRLVKRNDGSLHRSTLPPGASDPSSNTATTEYSQPLGLLRRSLTDLPGCRACARLPTRRDSPSVVEISTPASSSEALLVTVTTPGAPPPLFPFSLAFAAFLADGAACLSAVCAPASQDRTMKADAASR